jgi:hypothetical protein
MTDLDEATAAHIAESLRSFGLNAVSWDSGGGIIGVGIAPGGTPPDELRFFFGTAAETWAGEVLNGDGEVEAGLTTSVPTSTKDTSAIAASILYALADFASSTRA